MKRIIGFLKRYLYAIFSCIYLFTVGVFSTRHRSFIERICVYFGYDKGFQLDLPQVDLSDLISQEPWIQIRESENSSGNVTLFELMTIIKFIWHYTPQRVFEIGTFDGRTSLNMAANCPEESKVFTLDLQKSQLNTTTLTIEQGDREFINKDKSGVRFVGTDCEKKITQLYGDSAVFDFAPYQNTMNLVFVDGSHSYDYVVSDTRNALKLLKDGKGIILWHDYGGWEGATRALNELYHHDPQFKELKHIRGTSLACLIIA